VRTSPFAAAVLVLLVAIPWTAGASSILSSELVLAAEHGEASGVTGEVTGSQRNAIGLEWFATGTGGRLTFDLQARLSHDAEGPGQPGAGIEVHNAWLEYRPMLGRRLRLGHFSPAFGLEPDVDTHGTLLQTQAAFDIGFKKDWGVGWKQMAGPGDLTVALQTGSGAALDRRDGSYLATARYTLPMGPNTRAGVSALRGRTLRAPDARTLPIPSFGDEARERSRFGCDIVHDAGDDRVLAELSLGADGDEARISLLGRVERTLSAMPRFRVSVQTRLSRMGAGSAAASALALDYRLNNAWTVSVALVRNTGTDCDDTGLQLLLYHFGRIA